MIKTIESLKKEILEKITSELNKLKGELDDYTIAWKQLQDISGQIVLDILTEKLPKDTVITIPESKSTYPDIKISTKEGNYAIDIKGNESSKNPWFDMARLDTFEKERLNKYIEEWEIVIKYDSETKEFVKAYFLLFREVVGVRNGVDCLKYRPYDGKIRPKNWSDFDDNIVHWSTKANFKEGLKKAILHRWENIIKKDLLPNLSADDKNNFKSFFE